MKTLFLSSILAVAHGCTTVLVPTDNGTVIARTMELGIPFMPSELEKVYIHSRNTSVATLRGSLPPSKFGFVAIQFNPAGNFTLPLGTTEGINEAGLTVSLQTHTLAVYEPANLSKPTAIGDLTAAEYLLGCCATVDEAADALAALNVVPTPLIGKSAIGSIHLSVQDSSGASRVLEYVDGALRVYDNTDVGVLTNDPSYEWQVGNLNQYAAYPTSHSEARFALKVKSRGPFTSFAVASDGGETSTPVDPSHGTHTRFLPGGYTPPDRFVKMFLLKQTAVAHAPPRTIDDGIALATGLANVVHIPRGAIAGPGLLEYTNWAVLKVPSARLFFYRTYENMQWKKLDLTKLDFSGATKYAPLALYEAGMGVREVSPSPTPL